MMCARDRSRYRVRCLCCAGDDGYRLIHLDFSDRGQGRVDGFGNFLETRRSLCIASPLTNTVGVRVTPRATPSRYSSSTAAAELSVFERRYGRSPDRFRGSKANSPIFTWNSCAWILASLFEAISSESNADLRLHGVEVARGDSGACEPKVLRQRELTMLEGNGVSVFRQQLLIQHPAIGRAIATLQIFVRDDPDRAGGHHLPQNAPAR